MSSGCHCTPRQNRRRGSSIASMSPSSDHAVAMIMAWLRGIVPFDREVKAGRWDPSGAKLRRAANLTAGILGYGRIGRASARKLAGIGLTVLAHDIAPPGDGGPARMVDRDALLAESDIIIVHLPLTAETEHLVDAAFLSRMRQGSLLVNVSPTDGLRDNILLALAKLIRDDQLRTERLTQLNQEHPNTDGGMRALYELTRLKIRLYQQEDDSNREKRKLLADAREMLASFLALYSDSFYAEQVKRNLEDLPKPE